MIQNLHVRALKLLPRNSASDGGNLRRVIFSRAYAVRPYTSPSSFSSFSVRNEEEIKRHESHNVAICIATLQSCAQRCDATSGEQVHGFMVRKVFLDHSPEGVTSLINMYAKCSQMRRAVSVFDRFERNVFNYNVIISGFVVNGFPLDAMKIYREMRAEGIFPDKYTFPSLIKASCEAMDISEVKKVHGLVFRLGLDSDCYVGSALVKCYLKFVLMEDAQKVFDELPERDDVVLWNAMINGYSQISRFEYASRVFMDMREGGIEIGRYTITGVLSAFTAMGELGNGRSIHCLAVKMGFDSGIAVSNALIDMYGKSKNLLEAVTIFEGMDERDIFSWNSILCVHDFCGDHEGALALFNRMLRCRIPPDLVTLTTVLPSCACLAALMQGREIHGYMIVTGLLNPRISKNVNNVFISNALMDMYSKCGNMWNAHSVFDTMGNTDTASWNIMITGYGVHGHGKLALEMFSQMCRDGFKPDEVTFVGVLTACNHSGFVSEGRGFLTQMDSVYGVVPTIEHYACVIDMLGRAGRLKEAYDLAITMPVEANPVVWRTLLASSRLHGNIDLAKVAGQHLLELEPEHCGSYVLMSNVFVEAGKYEEVLDVRDAMRQKNVRKKPGCSWIELKNRVHTFLTSDRNHLESESIFCCLDLLICHMHGRECMLEALQETW
ncbi:PREDICTED: pentatricopeptide repeat-containing protein At3g14730 [Tarenaya hassleriana]|uniref:pentatricopeptide repeat-containing protein At3g14730 n=1 Tax=Tarenaya hassleriana TaxID=28532 RepID=UPI00053C4B78|nr:PREDICTED: pentatricopeptide repeat-containing protein At3g14730 [Tarenaya hassleriana]